MACAPSASSRNIERTMKITISEREQYAIAVALLTKIQPKDRTERRLFRRVVDELQIRGYADALATESLRFMSSTPNKTIEVELSGTAADYVLDKLERMEVPGPVAAQVMDVEERIIDAKNAAKE